MNINENSKLKFEIAAREKISKRSYQKLKGLYKKSPPFIKHIYRYIFGKYEYHKYHAFKKANRLLRCEWGIYCSASIGDTFATHCLLNSFIEHHRISKVKLLVKKNHRHISTYFPSHLVEVIIDENGSMASLSRFENAWGAGKWFNAHFPNCPFDIATFFGYKALTFMDFWKARFRLPFDTAISQPIPIPINELDDAEQFLRRNSLRVGKTVLLAPEAQTLKMLPWSWWKQLATSLGNMGWGVLWNSPVPGLASDSRLIPLRLLRGIAYLAGSVVSLRSGLCDLLAFDPIKLIVLYPREKIDWYSGNPANMQDAKNWFLGDSLKTKYGTSALELQVDDILDTQQLDAICEYISR